MGAKVQIQSNQFLPLGKVRMGYPTGKVRMGYPTGKGQVTPANHHQPPPSLPRRGGTDTLDWLIVNALSDSE